MSTQINGAQLPLGIVEQLVGVSAEGMLVRQPDSNGDGVLEVPVTAQVNDLTGGLGFSSGKKTVWVPDQIVQTSYRNGQPHGLSRLCTKPGEVVSTFTSTDGWALSTGTEGVECATTQDFTGYDVSGNVTGVISRTGQPAMRKVNVLTSGQVVLRKTTAVSLNGLIGLWVYIAAPAGKNNFVLTLMLSTTANGGGDIVYGYNHNQLKANAWNFIVAARSADPVSNTDKEAHPFGVSEQFWGSYANAKWVTGVTQRIFLYIENAAGCTFYLDSMWTGWESTPQFVLGADMSGQDTIDYVLPKFEQYGWKGYIAEPYQVVGTFQTPTNWNAKLNSAALDAVYSAGWDVINHSVNHMPIGTYADPARIRYEIEAARAWLLSLGYLRGNEFYASPQGSTSELSRKVIADCGIKLQRHGVHDGNHATMFGIDEPTWIGSVDVGGDSWLHNQTDAINFPDAHTTITDIRAWVDMIIKYKAVGMPFWHGVKVLGDPGDGTGNSGSNVYMFKSTFDMMMDYIAQKEAAGLCRVPDGMSGFYYGIGR